MEFDFDIDTTNLTQLAEKFTLSPEEEQQVTRQGANILGEGIKDAVKGLASETGGSKEHVVNGVVYHNRTQHFPGLENSVFIEKEEGRKSTAVTFDSSQGYYWRFVDEGHYVLDNRPDPRRVDKNGNAIRNYKYRLTTLDHGNRRFPGLHFVDTGVLSAKDGAVAAMRQAFLKKLSERGMT